MLYRKFYKTSTLLQLYISFIQPHLEYCSPVWDPYLTQKFGLKICLKNWSSDYSDLLSTAGILTLSSRRSQARLSHMFKIMHEQTDFLDVPIDWRTFHYSSRSDNSMAIKPFQCRSSQFLHSFFPGELQHSGTPCQRVWSLKILFFTQTFHK